MNEQIQTTIYTVSTWALPLIIAITFHEAAHGSVARLFGDNTASRLGLGQLQSSQAHRPVRNHSLAGIVAARSLAVLFGYAKPVPVNFHALRNPRRDMIWVAAAGPAMNLALAAVAALGFHLIAFLPAATQQWIAQNLQNALVINVLLAIFNLIPIPPLDGGRIAVGILPDALAQPLARLERYGMAILIGVLFVLPILGRQFGVDLNVVTRLVARSTYGVVQLILRLTGNA